MLTEGDHIQVNRGGFSGLFGEVADASSKDNLIAVELEDGNLAHLMPEFLDPVVDNVSHPSHYRSHPSGIECIQITEHMGFNLGNATKYIWRSDLKGNAIEDLRKAAWYINREIAKREATS